MVWPFSRRRAPAKASVRPKGLDEADRDVLLRLVEWIDEEQADYQAALEEDAVQVHPTGREGAPPVLMAYARKGKLVRLEVREETPRSFVDDLVRTFEKRGLWSFNGVVRTLSDPE